MRACPLLAIAALAFATTLATPPRACAAVATVPAALIKAGRLIDTRAGAVRETQWIEVSGERITAVHGPEFAPPAGATVIDLTGWTVLPGLIDTHTHLIGDPTLPPYHGYALSVPRWALKGAANARETLLSGVTSVRDVGAQAYADVALRDAINAGEVVGPRMRASGPALGITGGHCDSNLLAPEYAERTE